MKAETDEEAVEEKFKGSRGWFRRFKERSHLQKVKVQGEAANTDAEIVASYPEDPAKLINKDDYT